VSYLFTNNQEIKNDVGNPISTEVYNDGSVVSDTNRFPVSMSAVTGGSDAFGRLRISEAFTLGDYKHTYGIDQNFLNIVSNGGTITHNANQASARLTTTSNSSSYAIHQTKQYHNYMPGKSQLIKSTINFYSPIANVVKRTGYFDDRNGIYFEQAGDGTLSFVIRTDTTGTPSDARRVTQAQWNVDTCNTTIVGTSTDGTNSGVSGSWTLDITKTQIFFIDFQWLGVGRVRCGFVHNGNMIVAHEFYNSNYLPVVYMSNPNLPVRCEIRNTGTTTGGSFDQICSTVVSEGGYAESGIDWAIDSGTASQNVPLGANYPIVAIRLKSTFKGYPNRVMLRMGNVNVYAEQNPVYWKLIKLSGLSSITLSSPTWTSVSSESAVEYTILGTAISGGDVVDNGFVGTSSPGGSAKGTGTGSESNPTAAKRNFITQNFDCTDSEIYVVCAQSIGAAANVWCGIQWREIY
jgi:hypothetical protein